MNAADDVDDVDDDDDGDGDGAGACGGGYCFPLVMSFTPVYHLGFCAKSPSRPVGPFFCRTGHDAEPGGAGCVFSISLRFLLQS